MSRQAAFDPRVILALVVVGALLFVALLWGIGVGGGGDPARQSGGHAASRGLDGYHALAELAKKRGIPVRLSRSAAHDAGEDLLVLTPPHSADGEEIENLLATRRYDGPTLVVLPKWYGVPAQREPAGWVRLIDTEAPYWPEDVPALDGAQLVQSGKQEGSWRLGAQSGRLPRPDDTQFLGDGTYLPIATGENGAVLAAALDDATQYDLRALAGLDVDAGDDRDPDAWPLVVVAEPDLINNFGLADRRRAEAALALITAAMDQNGGGVVFDLTLNGLAAETNLLTLAFTPPFVAATLCLLLAALAVGWRAFVRFGPAAAPVREMAFGKTQLVANGAALVQRARRLHLLGEPLGDLRRRRIAALLGVRSGADPHETDQIVADRLARRGFDGDAYRSAQRRLPNSDERSQLIADARTLTDIERTLAP